MTGSNEWKFPRLRESGVSLHLLSTRTLQSSTVEAQYLNPSATLKSKHILTGRGSGQASESPAPHTFVPFGLLKQAQSESYELTSGFAYDPHYRDLISSNPLAEAGDRIENTIIGSSEGVDDESVNTSEDLDNKTRLLYACQDGTVCTAYYAMNQNSSQQAKMQPVSKLSVPGIVYQCQWTDVTRDQYMVRTPSHLTGYSSVRNEIQWELAIDSFDAVKEYHGPDLSSPIFAESVYNSVSKKTAIANNRGLIGVYSADMQAESHFVLGDLGVNFGYNDWFSKWTRLQWDAGNLLVADRKNILYVDPRSQIKRNSARIPIEDHAYVCDMKRTVDGELYCLTTEKLKWFDIRYTKSPLLEWRHGLASNDSGLKLTQFNIPRMGHEICEQTDVVAVYSELQQGSASIFQFGRQMDELGLPLSLDDPRELCNYAPAHGQRFMHFIADDKLVSQLAVTTAGDLRCQVYRLDDRFKNNDSEDREVDGEEVADVQISIDSDRPTEVPSSGPKGASMGIPRIVRVFPDIMAAPPLNLAQSALDQLRSQIVEILQDISTSDSDMTLANRLSKVMDLEPVSFNPSQVYSLLDQLKEETSMNIRFERFMPDVPLNQLVTYLSSLWELERSSDSWLKYNRDCTVAHLINLLLFNLTTVKAPSLTPPLQKSVKVPNELQNIFDEWEILEKEEPEPSIVKLGIESQMELATLQDFGSISQSNTKDTYSQSQYTQASQTDSPLIRTQSARSTKRAKRPRKKRNEGFA